MCRVRNPSHFLSWSEYHVFFFFIGGRGRALSAALTNEQCPNKTGRFGRQRSHAKPSVTSSKCLGWNTIQKKTRGSQSHKNTSTPVHALVRSTHKRRMGAERWRVKGKTSHRLYKWPSTAREPQHSYGAASPVVLCSRASQNNSLQDVPVWSTWIRRRIWRLCLFSELHAWSHWARDLRDFDTASPSGKVKQRHLVYTLKLHVDILKNRSILQQTQGCFRDILQDFQHKISNAGLLIIMVLKGNTKQNYKGRLK